MVSIRHHICTFYSTNGHPETVLKTSLRSLFKSYGEVLDVVAHGNLRMRGQAFVSFASPEIAAKAMGEVRGFPLYSKPMVERFSPIPTSYLTSTTANIIRKIKIRRGRKTTGCREP